MRGRSVKSNLELDVTFVSNAKTMLKNLEGEFSKLHLDTASTNQLSKDLSKVFSNTQNELSRMGGALSKPGLSTKEYTQLFDTIHTRLTGIISTNSDLKKSLKDAFESTSNKDSINSLKIYKKQLEEINTLVSSNKGLRTRQGSAASKINSETGLDMGNKEINSTLYKMKNRSEAGMGYTNSQKSWLSNIGLDEDQLERVYDLLAQIDAYESKIKSNNARSTMITGEATSEKAQAALQSNIGKTSKQVYSKESYEEDLETADKLNESYSNVKKSLAGMSEEYYGKVLPAGEEHQKQLDKADSTLEDVAKRFGLVWSADKILDGFQNMATAAISFYKSLDSALNEIYVVSNLSMKTVSGLKSSFINMAEETGAAIDDVTRAAVLFYQQGLNTQEVLTMTKVTSDFAKVAGIDATNAADKLTAAVNGYCLSAADASSVADKFSKVAAVSAADTNELSTAFSKAAAQANQAGISMDNYLAYIATMEEATREAPENLGTSLKTIFSRMQQIKKGDNTEDSTDVNDVETALKTVGVSLRDTKGELRDLEDVFDDLGPKWKSLDRNTQAYLGTIIAGTRQQSRFITLMQNWDRVLDLSKESQNSAGQQSLMHAKAMESLESKTQLMNVAWQKFISNLTNSGAIKTVVVGLTSLLKLVNTGNKPVTLLAIGMGLLATKLKQFQEPLKNAGLKIFDSAKGMLGKAGANTFDSDEAKNLAISKLQVSKANILSQAESLRGSGNASEEELVALKEKENSIDAEIVQKQKMQVLPASERIATLTTAIGTGISVIGLGLSSADQTVGGLVSSFGTILTSVGMLKNNPIGAVVTALTSVYQLMVVINNVSEAQASKITDAVQGVSDSLESFSNQKVSTKSLEALRDEYIDLSKKAYLTTAEQEKLNTAVQSIADSVDGIDAVSDSYGNLSIDIGAVNDKIDEMKVKAQSLAKDLRSQELISLDSATSLFSGNTIESYFSKLWGTSGSQYKSLLTGITETLTDQSSYIASTVATKFNDNLKTAMTAEVKNNSYAYIGEGLATSLTGMEDKVNEVFSKDNGQALKDVYSQITDIKNNIDDMSYDDVQNKLNTFYDNWTYKNDLTKTQWSTIVDSINNTVFTNTSLNEFYSKIDDLKNKYSGDYYTSQIKTLKEQQSKLDEFQKSLTPVAVGASAGVVGGAVAASKLAAATSGANPLAIAAGAVVGGIAGYATYANSDEGKKTTAVKKAIKELEEEQKKYKDELLKTHSAYLYNIDDVDKWVDAQVKVEDTLKSSTSATQTFAGKITSLFDFDKMTASESDTYANIIQNVIKNVDTSSTQSVATDSFISLMNTALTDPSLDSGVKDKLQAVITDAYNSLTLPSGMTFTQLSDGIEKSSKSLQTMNAIMADIKESGGMPLDNFSKLAGILDDVDISSLFSMGDADKGLNYVNEYISALGDLNLGYDANTGAITANGKAMTALQTIQEISSRSKIESMKSELVAAAAQIKTEIAYVDAQIAGNNAILSALSNLGDGEISYSDLKSQADDVTRKSFGDTVTALAEGYKTENSNNNSWTMATLKNIDTVSQAWGRYYEAMKGNGTADLSDLYAQAQNAQASYEGVDLSNYDTDNNGTVGSSEKAALQAALEKSNTGLENYKKSLTVSLDTYNTEIGLLGQLSTKNLGNLGTDKGNSSDADVYEGKLQKIYNILNKIAVLEHSMSTIDSYLDIGMGNKQGDYLVENLNNAKDLVSEYAILTEEQKKNVNGWQEKIKSSSLNDVFDFDASGQIIINWEKYINLQDTATKNNKSMKEQADELYNSYKDAFQSMDDYFDKLIDAQKKVIDYNQKALDAYKTVEEQAANAIKEIYQDRLDAQLKAIEVEEKALEELQTARENANKEISNAKTVSGYQTDLQRAMMDTSGSSDSAYIKAQQNISDTLSQMAEDKYSQKIEDIKSALSDEKDTLQNNFDTMFDRMDWLYGGLAEWIPNNTDGVIKLIESTDTFANQSTVERAQQTTDLSQNVSSYVAALGNGNYDGIKSLYDANQSLKESTANLEKYLSTDIPNDISTAAATIASSVSGSSSSKSSSSYSGSSSGSGSRNKSNSSNTSGGSSSKITATTASMRFVDSDGTEITRIERVAYGSNQTAPTYSKGGQDVARWVCSEGYVEPGGTIYVNWKNSTRTYTAEYAYEPNNIDDNGIQKDNNGNTYMSGRSLTPYATGGLNYKTGPAWLDGSTNKPEAVLDALQTQHFMNFTDTLDKLYSGLGGSNTSSSSSISIDNISFNVNSMSSAADGEEAFNTFINKVKQVGKEKGLSITSTKSKL